jgi:hypothetical protein
MLESINRGLRTLANTLLCLHFEDLAQITTQEFFETPAFVAAEEFNKSLLSDVVTKYEQMDDKLQHTASYSPTCTLNVRLQNLGTDGSKNFSVFFQTIQIRRIENSVEPRI